MQQELELRFHCENKFILLMKTEANFATLSQSVKQISQVVKTLSIQDKMFVFLLESDLKTWTCQVRKLMSTMFAVFETSSEFYIGTYLRNELCCTGDIDDKIIFHVHSLNKHCFPFVLMYSKEMFLALCCNDTMECTHNCIIANMEMPGSELVQLAYRQSAKELQLYFHCLSCCLVCDDTVNNNT
jgi:hypothetical protein